MHIDQLFNYDGRFSHFYSILFQRYKKQYNYSVYTQHFPNALEDKFYLNNDIITIVS